MSISISIKPAVLASSQHLAAYSKATLFPLGVGERYSCLPIFHLGTSLQLLSPILLAKFAGYECFDLFYFSLSVVYFYDENPRPSSFWNQFNSS